MIKIRATNMLLNLGSSFVQTIFQLLIPSKFTSVRLEITTDNNHRQLYSLPEQKCVIQIPTVITIPRLWLVGIPYLDIEV